MTLTVASENDRLKNDLNTNLSSLFVEDVYLWLQEVKPMEMKNTGESTVFCMSLAR